MFVQQNDLNDDGVPKGDAPDQNNPSLPHLQASFPQSAAHAFDEALQREYMQLHLRQEAGESLSDDEWRVPVILMASAEGLASSLEENLGLDSVYQLMGEIYHAQLDLRQVEAVAADSNVSFVEREQMSSAQE